MPYFKVADVCICYRGASLSAVKEKCVQSFCESMPKCCFRLCDYIVNCLCIA